MKVTVEDLAEKVEVFGARLAGAEKDIADIKSDLGRKWDDDIIPMRTQVGEIRTKVYNGLSEIPKRVSWLTAAFVTLLIALLALMYQVGSTQAKVMAEVEAVTEQLEN